jgi:hypothetical protein
LKRYALALGDSEFEKPEDVIRRLARSSLIATKPTRLITDYSVGWNSLVLDEATKLGIPYMGVLPYASENPNFRELSKSATNLVFFNSKEDFLANPFLYFNWLQEHVDEVLCYLNPERHTYNKNILRTLKTKSVRNLFH